jgi:hypothetical protein
MGKFDHLGQTLAEQRAIPCAPPKSIPTPARKDEERHAKKLTDDAFRKLIWKLDGGKSRATGKPLAHSGTTSWHELGEVDHSIPRSLAPDRIYDPSNALLLSKWENRMRKIPCIRAPEFKYFDYSGPDDRRRPQTFVWRDDDGTVVKTRIG